MRKTHPGNILAIVGWIVLSGYLEFKFFHWQKFPTSLLGVALLAVVASVAADPSVPYKTWKGFLAALVTFVIGLLVVFLFFK